MASRCPRYGTTRGIEEESAIFEPVRALVMPDPSPRDGNAEAGSRSRTTSESSSCKVAVVPARWCCGRHMAGHGEGFRQRTRRSGNQPAQRAGVARHDVARAGQRLACRIPEGSWCAIRSRSSRGARRYPGGTRRNDATRSRAVSQSRSTSETIAPPQHRFSVRRSTPSRSWSSGRRFEEVADPRRPPQHGWVSAMSMTGRRWTSLHLTGCP